MKITTLTETYAVSGQITSGDLQEIRAFGFKTVINNRPDGESADQPSTEELKHAAEALGLKYLYRPVVPNEMPEAAIAGLRQVLTSDDVPVLGFCRTGNRSSKVFEALTQATSQATSQATGQATGEATQQTAPHTTQVLVVGGGAAGLATTASLLKRDPNLEITVVEPKETHYYQPGWTMVGGGVFSKDQTMRQMVEVMPRGATWLQAGVTEFLPATNQVVLSNGDTLNYEVLVVAPGIKLDWDKIEGGRESLGANNVSSNYELEHAPNTWRFVQSLKAGKAVFTQPPMPIKCAGAPQKAMYLSADHWAKQKRLGEINIEFYNAGAVLFGVSDYVPALEEYIKRYDISLSFGKNLVAVDGPSKTAWFEDSEGGRQEVKFDLLHIAPPQTTPDFVKHSPLANEAGWIDVFDSTLQHTVYRNVFSLGDACSAPNAKTAAAVRKQAPVVAHNIISLIQGRESVAHYDGYGSCPLIVERGKVVLAEFGYGGKILPTVPTWLVNGKRPGWAGWFLKASLLPPIYFDLMLKGHEWLASPAVTDESIERLLESSV